MSFISKVYYSHRQRSPSQKAQQQCVGPSIWTHKMACTSKAMSIHWQDSRSTCNCDEDPNKWNVMVPLWDMRGFRYHGTQKGGSSSWTVCSSAWVEGRWSYSQRESKCWSKTKEVKSGNIQILHTGWLCQDHLKIWAHQQLQHTNCTFLVYPMVYSWTSRLLGGAATLTGQEVLCKNEQKQCHAPDHKASEMRGYYAVNRIRGSIQTQGQIM